MRIKLTLISGLSLGLMLCGLYLAFTQSDAFLGKRVFFTVVGILGWLIGNKLLELEERLAELESRDPDLAQSQCEPSPETSVAQVNA